MFRLLVGFTIFNVLENILLHDIQVAFLIHVVMIRITHFCNIFVTFCLLLPTHLKYEQARHPLEQTRP